MTEDCEIDKLREEKKVLEEEQADLIAKRELAEEKEQLRRDIWKMKNRKALKVGEVIGGMFSGLGAMIKGLNSKRKVKGGEIK